MVYLSRPYHLKFFKGCLPQILLRPFLNILSHVPYNNITLKGTLMQIWKFANILVFT